MVSGARAAPRRCRVLLRRGAGFRAPDRQVMSAPKRLFEVVRLDDPERFHAFCELLSGEGIPFYLSDERPGTVFVADVVTRAVVLERLEVFEDPTAHQGLSLAFLAPLLLRAPATAAVLVLMLLGAPLTAGFEQMDFGELFFAMTFTNERGGEIADGQYWRLLTPIFIHFGFVHLAFNMLGIYVVGSRLEPLIGSTVLVLLVLLSGAVGNVAQFLLGNSVYFGGMSGVLMALVGFAFLWSRLRPERDPGLPQGLYLVCILMTVLGFTGLLDGLTGEGSGIANWAHLGGLLTGMAAGVLAAPIYRKFSA